MINPALETRTSDCSTIPFRSPFGTQACDSSTRGIDNGMQKGGVAICVTPGGREFTYLRTFILLHAFPSDFPAPALDFRLCAWDYATREPVAWTDNLAGPLNALTGQVDPQIGAEFGGDLVAPLSLDEGQWVILGTATYGDYPVRNCQLSSVGIIHGAMAIEPQLGFKTEPTIPATKRGERPIGGYEGGEPFQIGAEASGNYPWMDLL